MPAVGKCGVYNAFNRSVKWNNGSSHNQIVYDASGAKLAYMSGQTLQKYMLPLAAGVQAVFNSSGIWYYRHSDWLGSSRLALDTNGNLYAGRAYAPFGETYAETGAADRSFTGQTQDVLTGQNFSLYTTFRATACTRALPRARVPFSSMCQKFLMLTRAARAR